MRWNESLAPPGVKMVQYEGRKISPFCRWLRTLSKPSYKLGCIFYCLGAVGGQNRKN